MEIAISGDGTQIACERGGSGPTLLLVHGTGADHTYWERLAPELVLQEVLRFFKE